MVSLIVLGGAQYIASRKKHLKEELLKERKARKHTMPIHQTEAITISSFITSSRIILLKQSVSYQSAIESMIRTFPVNDPVSVFQAIQERDKIGSTAINPEVAFPHARVSGLNQIIAALALCPSGVKTPCGASIRLFLTFVSPSGETKQHLRFLAGAASLFLIENLVEELAALATPEAVMEKIREIEYGNRKAEALKHA